MKKFLFITILLGGLYYLFVNYNNEIINYITKLIVYMKEIIVPEHNIYKKNYN